MTTDLVLTDELLATIEENAVQVCKADELGREDWLRFRKPYIGGSEAAASIGLNAWRSPYALWLDKTTDTVSDEDNDYLRWGRRLEEAIGHGISEDTGIPVQRYPYMLASRKWPWAAVNLDFIAPNSVVEVKNVSSHMSHEWDNGAVPTSYAIQGQHALAVTGLPGIHYFPLVGGHEGRPVFIERNDALIESLMQGEQRFWELVETLTPPEIDGSASTERALKAQFGNPEQDSEIDLSFAKTTQGVTVEELLQRRALAKAIVKEQDGIIKECENQMKAWLGNHEVATVNGITRFTWRSQTRPAHPVAESTFRKLHVVKP